MKKLVITLALAASVPAWAASPRESLIQETVFPSFAPDPAVTALDAPLPGAPVSSGFGWRQHPVLNLRRFHNGVDYAAALGTPVHAADDGVVEQIGRHPDYGLYLRIRHSNRLETGYAHLHGIARGLRVGSTVHRGEVVASVGETGWATGPHLFYEVFVDGQRVDPQPAAPQTAERDGDDRGAGGISH
jgi:murein DD-endopeptidase MepM/ murein hydrolase activator NlpD